MKASPLSFPSSPDIRVGILIHSHPQSAQFQHAVQIAEQALSQRCTVFVYCLDEAVLGITELVPLHDRGLRILACALAATQRDMTMDSKVVYGGLGLLSDVIEHSDTVYNFN